MPLRQAEFTSCLEYRSCSFDQIVSRPARTAQIETAGGQVTVTPWRGEVVIVLENSRAELVIVRVASFEEYKLPGRVNQLFGVRLFL